MNLVLRKIILSITIIIIIIDKKIRNVFITPHIAGLSDNNRKRGYELIKENLYRYLNNQELLNIVDKKKEY